MGERILIIFSFRSSANKIHYRWTICFLESHVESETEYFRFKNLEYAIDTGSLF